MYKSLLFLFFRIFSELYSFFIVSVPEFYRGGKVDLNDPLVYHRLIEAEKFAYAQRTKLGDVRFVESAKNLVANMSTP